MSTNAPVIDSESGDEAARLSRAMFNAFKKCYPSALVLSFDGDEYIGEGDVVIDGNFDLLKIARSIVSEAI